MKASEVMDPHPSTLKTTDTIESAVEIIMSNRYRTLPVVDDDFCFFGIFGINCLLKQVIPKSVFMDKRLRNVSFIHESLEELYERFAAVKDQPISICMNKDSITVDPDTPLTETLLMLYKHKVSLPVVEKGSCKLLGMISYFDIGEKILQAGIKTDA